MVSKLGFQRSRRRSKSLRWHIDNERGYLGNLIYQNGPTGEGIELSVGTMISQIGPYISISTAQKKGGVIFLFWPQNM